MSKDGCSKCGKCCFDGYIKDRASLNIFDIRRIEKFTKMKREQFTETDISSTSGKEYLTLKYLGDEKHCIFFDEESKLCKIYEIRPRGCKLYPTDSNVCIEGRMIHKNDFIRSLKRILIF